MKKTILLFDSWSFGYKFFELYIDELIKNDFKVCFVHMDKLQLKALHKSKADELKKYSAMVSSKIESYDISKPETLSELVSKYPNPDFILHLSISHLENRLFNLIYKNAGARFIYVQHGNIFGVDSAGVTIKSLNRFQSNFNVRFIYKLNKVRKLFVSYFKYSHFVKSLVLLKQWLNSPRKFVLRPSYHQSLNFDLAFSFSEDERQHLSQKYFIALEKIFVITNPEIFLLSEYSNSFDKPPTKLVFIDQALSESGIISLDQQKNDYYKCSAFANSLNMNFVVRPHPRTIIDNYSETGFEFESKDFREMLSENCLYIGYNSSLMKTLLELGFYVIHLLPEEHDFRHQSILSDREKSNYPLHYFESRACELQDVYRKMEFQKANDGKIRINPATFIVRKLGS